jgi:transcriptional regulator with XRE-family HTH domain
MPYPGDSRNNTAEIRCQGLRNIVKVWHYAAMAGKEPNIGPTSRTVAENVKRWRDARNMSYRQFSDKLQTAAQWPISPVGIRRIESGERRVTPDDLTALAVALRVSPVTLLMPGLPDTEDPDEMVKVTGIDNKVPADKLWLWLQAEPSGASLVGLSPMEFILNALPKWLHPKWIKDTPDGG